MQLPSFNALIRFQCHAGNPAAVSGYPAGTSGVEQNGDEGAEREPDRERQNDRCR
jgi:hypothetical protein